MKAAMESAAPARTDDNAWPAHEEEGSRPREISPSEVAPISETTAHLATDSKVGPSIAPDSRVDLRRCGTPTTLETTPALKAASALELPWSAVFNTAAATFATAATLAAAWPATLANLTLSLSLVLTLSLPPTLALRQR